MKKTLKSTLLAILTLSFVLITSCRSDDPVVPSKPIVINPDEKPTEDIQGFFLLNEGNMGSNKASLDFYDYTTGIYHRNIFGERNPGEIKDLGDVGNDIQIYGNKLYAVINVSNYLEVMDVATVKHITKIAIPNCRYVTFKDDYAYVSSYAGPVKIDPNARIGYVAKVDTATLQVVAECTVGYQPEEMVIFDNKLYVANSGGYRAPNYDRTVSVIDLNTFTEIKKIDVGINLHRMEIDRYGYIYVSSRGDYYNTPSKTYVINTKTEEVKEIPNLPNSNMTRVGDDLYIYSTEFNYNTKEWTVSYAIVDTPTQKIKSRNFIKDGTDKKIKTPYGIAVHPSTGDIFITDAKDYVSPGVLYCFNKSGIKKWSVTTGDIPAHMVFTRKKLKTKN
ncbi:YncE family protein [Porphyromonas sp.]|uniref:YncE family protein n=1 Tax=Porphyromonas sp. TaxID=1924944 RepID=UPI0026DBAC2E|nr:DUF5074 domain-containing protein [Porphyromonas sp.]MDO4770886.1 YncE family protein [Porphyromonas sp.]